MELRIIARIRTDFPEKFGIPRQSGLVEELSGRIVFEPGFRDPDALRGLEGYSHLWILWQFEDSARDGFVPTVRPPRLGGNTRMGVFATRSPFRPNPIGLSCVKIAGIEEGPEGPVIRVLGADLRDNTPIFDLKPYLPFTDAHPDARGGFAEERRGYALEVDAPPELLSLLPEEKRQALLGILAQDPRPSYQDDPERIYGLSFAGYAVRFRVEDGRLTVTELRAETHAE